MTTNTNPVLTMSLEELRERVDLAERLALAARLTPSGAYDAPLSGVNTAEATPPKTTRKKAAPAADAAAAGTTTAPAPATEAAAGSADDMIAAMTPTTEAADTGGVELSLDEITSGDDMLAGFEIEAEPEKTPAEYRAMANAIITDIQTTKDTARLAVARQALQTVGVQKAGEVGDDKIKQFYDLLPK